jgi:hypothetical protein
MLPFAAVAVGFLLGWAAVRLAVGYPPATGFRRLARREVAFLRAAGDTLFPAGGPLPPSGSEARIAEYVDDYLGVVPARMRVLMRLLFFLVEHATLFLPAPGWNGFRRFSSLDEAQRAAVFEGWRRSPLVARRVVFTSLRAVLTNCYVADPAVLRNLGVAPFEIETPVAPAALLYPRIGAPKASIAYGPSSLTAPSDGTPLALDGPLHPGYREGPT